MTTLDELEELMKYEEEDQQKNIVNQMKSELQSVTSNVQVQAKQVKTSD